MTFLHHALIVVGGMALVGCGFDEIEPDISSSTAAASLVGSLFEIDTNANLKRDGAAPAIDWATVTETRSNDTATGQNDNSFGGGSKEDDTCPTVGTGSIPNNKSDLKTFGVYHERSATPGDPGFLHVFWSRVQDPTGTTLMDFEFNQSSTDCGNGVNPERTIGDFLLEYRLEQGGATASIKIREWNGTAWGTAVDLTQAGAATGTINTTAIPAGEADGLGALSARTFGEASIDLDFVFDPQSCRSFGSAFVKSRSSDAFNSALKDFIAPTPINLTNCGQVIIRKVTDPSGSTDSFAFTHNLVTDPSSGTSFNLTDGGNQTFTNVLLGSNYTVTESTATGWDLSAISCTASTGVTPTVSVANRNVTFSIDDPSDVVDCTFTNRARGTVIIEKVTSDSAGTFSFTSQTLSPGSFSLTTTAAGTAGKASQTFSNLAPGTYDAAETVPAGYNLASATCSDGSPVSAIALSGGETVTCTFVNVRQQGALRIVKTRKHAASGAGDHPHANVTFTVTGGSLPAAGVTVTTDSNGIACVPGLVLSSFVGNYTVTESVPTGYVVAGGEATKTVAVTQQGTCLANYAQVSYSNIPLTDITVSVNSLVDGGTASTISCVSGGVTVGSATTGANGDGSLTLSNRQPGTYTCTIVVDP